MNKAVCAVILIVSLQGASGSCWAGQRQHHPWFSRKASAPTVSSSPAEAAGNDVKRTATTNNIKGQQVVRQALHYKGTRYKFGGASKKGMDCSGLVSRVWTDLKLKKLPRASSALYNSGKPVHLAELEPGDLVFFKNTYKPGISHVGVYAGSNKFVHAANRRKGVTITRLSDPYYQLHYAGARRLY